MQAKESEYDDAGPKGNVFKETEHEEKDHDYVDYPFKSTSRTYTHQVEFHHNFQLPNASICMCVLYRCYHATIFLYTRIHACTYPIAMFIHKL